MTYERPKFTWLNPCKNCPSHWYPIDPMAKDILEESREFAEECAFSCAWRKGGYCTGYVQRIEEYWGSK